MLVEAKSVEKILPIHKAQLLSYMEPAKYWLVRACRDFLLRRGD
jgi:hypothetical protein